MGQKRIKAIDLNKSSAPEKKRKIAKSGKQQGRLTDMGATALAEAEKIAKKEKEAEKKITKASKKEKETVKKRQRRVRSKRYKALKLKFDSLKSYPLNEAVSLLCDLANSRIDETVELHISTRVDKLTGSVNFPHGTGKKQKIAIADDKIIDDVSNGKIDFDILIAEPKMMGKISSVAKILGPKGLMPNPKTGTITDKPEALKKKLGSGQARFRTEPKAPLLHMVIGKISMGEKKLLENLHALLEAVKIKNIKKAVLTSTHAPGIKLEVK